MMDTQWPTEDDICRVQTLGQNVELYCGYGFLCDVENVKRARPIEQRYASLKRRLAERLSR